MAQVQTPSGLAPPSEPPREPPAPAQSSTPKIVMWVLLVVGIGLGAFGLFRLTAGDSEVDRLNDELTAFQEDLSAVQDDLSAATSQGEEISNAAADVDAALVNLVEKLEGFGEAEREVLDTWVRIVESSPDDAALQTNVETTLQSAIDDSVAALEEAQGALDQAEAAVADLNDAIQRAGG